MSEIYAPGKDITVYQNFLGRARPEGRAKLVRREETCPSTGEHSIARWALRFYEEDGRLMEQECVRPVLEIGVPNENRPVVEDWSSYYAVNYDSSTEQLLAEMTNTQPVKRGRGRPKGSGVKKQNKRITQAVTERRAVGKFESDEAETVNEVVVIEPVVTEEDHATQAVVVADVEQTVKRGRGRPKLDPAEVARREAEKAARPKQKRGPKPGSKRKPKE